MLYHPLSGFPDTLIIPTLCMNLEYTKHALERAKSTYIPITKPTQALITWDKIVEVETPDDINATKIVLRTKYDNINDLILVLHPNFNTGIARVITLWTNDFRDTHRTLNKQYDKPKK